MSFFARKKESCSCLYSRDSAVIPFLKNLSFKVYNGKYLKKVRPHMFISCKKAGEFAFTRKPYFFPLKKK